MPETIERPETPAVVTGATVWKYVAVAYTFAWIPWIIWNKVHGSELMLNLGAAGPAIAALALSRRRRIRALRFRLRRVFLFLLAVAGCSVILSLYYATRAGSPLQFRWGPWSLIPSIAPAWILASALSPDPGIRDLAASLVRLSRWSLVALLIFPSIVFAGDAFARAFHRSLVQPGVSGSNTMVAAFVLFLYNFLFAAVLEEPGWRGCLLPLLQQRRSPLQATLFVWLAWALWHLPLDLSRPTRFSFLQYLEIRVLFLIPIAIILTWLYNRSSRSIQSCAVFHASMNTFPFVLPYWMPSFALLFVLAGAAIIGDRMWHKM